MSCREWLAQWQSNGFVKILASRDHGSNLAVRQDFWGAEIFNFPLMHNFKFSKHVGKASNLNQADKRRKAVATNSAEWKGMQPEKIGPSGWRSEYSSYATLQNQTCNLRTSYVNKTPQGLWSHLLWSNSKSQTKILYETYKCIWGPPHIGVRMRG